MTPPESRDYHLEISATKRQWRIMTPCRAVFSSVQQENRRLSLSRSPLSHTSNQVSYLNNLKRNANIKIVGRVVIHHLDPLLEIEMPLADVF